jgi:hypothetical protein
VVVEARTSSSRADDGSAAALPPGGSAAAGGAPADWPRRLGGSPLLRWWGLSLVLALISALAWPTVPSYDPFSWVVWGREVTDPHIGFFVGGGPSWKPLPFLFTAIYGAFGSVAPKLWVISARTGGIAGLIAAGRLAWLLCSRRQLPGWSRWVAGGVAAIGVLLTTDWSYYFFRGASEPLLIACALWTIDRALAGRHRQAYFLLVCEGLMRPEAWPFLLLYGGWLFFADRGVAARAGVLVGLAAQPVGWFVPPWISTGQPFLAATHASEYNGHLGANPFVTVLKRGESLQVLPALVLGFLAVLLALWLSRGRMAAGWRSLRRSRWRSGWEEMPLEGWLGLAVVAWWAVVVGMTLDGYPGLQRFFLPAAALTCVLGGFGLLWLASLAGQAAGGLLKAGRGVALAVAAVVVVALLAGSVHFASPRITFVRDQEPLARVAVRRIDQLGQAIAQLGGRSALLPCGSSVVTVNHSMQTALAWKLDTTLERVQTVLRVPGVAFVGPHDSIDGGVPPIAFAFTAHLLRRVGDWKIYTVARSGQSLPACVGR